MFGECSLSESQAVSLFPPAHLTLFLTLHLVCHFPQQSARPINQITLEDGINWALISLSNHCIKCDLKFE